MIIVNVYAATAIILIERAISHRWRGLASPSHASWRHLPARRVSRGCLLPHSDSQCKFIFNSESQFYFIFFACVRGRIVEGVAQLLLDQEESPFLVLMLIFGVSKRLHTSTKSINLSINKKIYCKNHSRYPRPKKACLIDARVAVHPANFGQRVRSITGIECSMIHGRK